MTKLGGKGPGIVAALFLFLFNTFFAIGWLGMTWLYPAEIVPLRIRAPANALSTSANWAFNFMGMEYPPVLLMLLKTLLIHSSRHDHARSFSINRLPNLHHFRSHVSPFMLPFPLYLLITDHAQQCIHLPRNLLLLPRDRLPLPRRNG